MNRRDRWHDWAVEAFGALEVPLWTCEAVLTEAAYLTGRPRALIERVAAGALRIGLDAEREAAGIEKLLARYGPRMDFADACVVRMSEIHRQSKVMTIDRRDFSVYRRNGREVIPLIAPA